MTQLNGPAVITHRTPTPGPVSYQPAMGPTGVRPAEEGEPLDNVGFAFFSDPDGNGWGVQQISARG
jgi:hypothetical protein